MTSKHTPGPWTALDLGREGTDRSWVVSNELSGVYTKADAHLIAAAPEMYEALRDLIEGVELRWGIVYVETGWHHDPNLMDRARAALAKAEGRS